MELNEVGKITSTHGLKGEVKVKTDSSFIEERFKVGSTLYYKIDGKTKELKVIEHRSMNGFELLTFKDFEDVDKAVILKNKVLYAEKKRELLNEGQVFYSDYIGLNVSFFNKIVGVVKEIVSFPQGDYLNITMNDGKEKLVPIRKEFIEKVDLDASILYIVPMEGLL